MSKRNVIILLVILAAGLILAVTIPPLLSSPSQIAQKAAGTWQETGETPAYMMQVVGAGSTYLVTYPRWRYDRESFGLQGDKLLGGGGENTMNDMVKTITYDNGSDQLTISDKAGERVYTFARVAQPSGIAGVMREVGGPFPGLRRHPNTLIEVHWGSETGPVVASATSSQNGKFKVIVAPGHYVVVPVAKGDETVGPDSVVVTFGTYAVARPFFSVR